MIKFQLLKSSIEDTNINKQLFRQVMRPTGQSVRLVSSSIFDGFTTTLRSVYRNFNPVSRVLFHSPQRGIIEFKQDCKDFPKRDTRELLEPIHTDGNYLSVDRHYRTTRRRQVARPIFYRLGLFRAKCLITDQMLQFYTLYGSPLKSPLWTRITNSEVLRWTITIV